MSDLNTAEESRTPIYDESAAIKLARDAILTRAAGASEAVVRQVLVGNLANTFPVASRPWWVERHVRGAEAQVQYLASGREGHGYVDSVVGLTAIEYEPDLRRSIRYKGGKRQVQRYCAGLLNTGAAPDKIRGILSDAVEWHVYRLESVPIKCAGDYDEDDVSLVEIERLELSRCDAGEAAALVGLLTRYLGREGTRPLTGASMSDYLGLGSGFGAVRLGECDRIIRGRMIADPHAADLVERVWGTFLSYLSIEPDAATFDPEVYVQEFYLQMLAKMLCANVIQRCPLRSGDEELQSILDGRFFEAKGLSHLVEHDYFGWLSQSGHVYGLLPLARKLQADLAAYDFDAAPQEDLFGDLMAELSQRTKRVLLGQERTPSWLASCMAQRLFEILPASEEPHFVDMCCGSGSMLIETTKLARQRLVERGTSRGSHEYVDYLVSSATGFDIDPLAVMLAKVNWVVANRDALEPFDGRNIVSLPVYHADALFAVAPVFGSSSTTTDEGRDYQLKLFDRVVELPGFLVRPDSGTLFDALIDRSASLAVALAKTAAAPIELALIGQIVDDAIAETNSPPAEEKRGAISDFVESLVETIADLQRQGRNEIWAFVIRNSYRPGLVRGQFNGIISNPPWLALSKIGANPFGPVLKAKARTYGLEPTGSAFLHLEMATVFLAYSVDHYLSEGGLVACVLPDTVRNGCQHLPFRSQLACYRGTPHQFLMRLDELWLVERGVFKNRAVVALGHKAAPEAMTMIPGKAVGLDEQVDVAHFLAAAGDRMVWSQDPPHTGVVGGYPAGSFSQGADMMPRRCWFFDTQPASGDRVTLSAIPAGGSNWFLVSKAKKHLDFRVNTRTIPARFVHRCLLSAHLGPFALAPPSNAVLPVLWTAGRTWRQAASAELAGAPAARDHFREVIVASDFTDVADVWRAGLDFRGKLSKQIMPPDGWLVVYGTGGGIPAAAFVPIHAGEEPPIVDQTLYWMVAGSEDEALYVCGLINSRSLLERIADFIPEGEFGDRHLHTLPAKTVPQYDAADEKHVAVVKATRKLVADLHELSRNEERVGDLFTTRLDMNLRRQRLRETIAGLPSSQEHEDACKAVYGDVGPSEGPA